MDDILDVLVAHGVPGATIVRVARLIADAQQTQARRTRNTERMKVVRTHAHTGAHTETQDAAFLSKEEKVYPRKEESKKDKKESRAKPKTDLPTDWQPIGDQRDPTEADEFRDHARAKGYRYSDWHAAYRNFQRSPFNTRNKAGATPQPASVLNFAAGFDARTRMQLAERAEIERQRRR